jgi:hypothetical protein
VPGIYWLAVVLISVVGTLVSDNLVENYGVTLETTTIAFSIALVAVFASWYAVERTLSVHTIHTARREAFYWLAILFAFALGTSAGDFLSEQLALGHLAALGIFAGAIVVVAVLHFGLRTNAILSFWLACVLTRPLGASIGDHLASPTLLNKVDATPSLLDAVRQRAAHGAARFVVLVPNPGHVGRALPRLRGLGGAEVSGRVANSPNAYDDIVEELETNAYSEIIVETPPSHVSHWLHVDLPQRVSGLGSPLTTVAAT